MHILEQDRDKQVQAKSHKNGISPNSSTTNLHKTANSFHYPLIFLQKTPQKGTRIGMVMPNLHNTEIHISSKIHS